MWLLLFEMYPEFRHLPLRERRKAAYHAQQRAMRRWQVLLTILFLIAATAGFSALDLALHISDQNGTGGAGFGFFLGFAALHWAFYRYGLHYYREALQAAPGGAMSFRWSSTAFDLPESSARRRTWNCTLFEDDHRLSAQLPILAMLFGRFLDRCAAGG